MYVTGSLKGEKRQSLYGHIFLQTREISKEKHVRQLRAETFYQGLTYYTSLTPFQQAKLGREKSLCSETYRWPSHGISTQFPRSHKLEFSKNEQVNYYENITIWLWQTYQCSDVNSIDQINAERNNKKVPEYYICQLLHQMMMPISHLEF